MMKNKLITVLDFCISILIYSLILTVFSLIFKHTLYIDSSYYGLTSVLASIIIFILNRTIKPLLVWITLPITALTLGLFYPVINLFVLKITDWILTTHFDIKGYIMPFIVAILISIVHLIIDTVVHKLLERENYE